MIPVFKDIETSICEVNLLDASNHLNKIEKSKFIKYNKLKELSNNLFLKENDSTKILSTIREIIYKTALNFDEVQFNELLTHTIEFSSKIELREKNGVVGIAAFATQRIQKGEYLLYAGELRIINKEEEKNNAYLMPIVVIDDVMIAVDGLYFRNMAAYISHLPDRDWLNENISFSKNEIKNQVATSNLKYEVVFIKEFNIILPILKATREIEPGEILGFDYGSDYWHELNIVPCLFDKKGNIIDNTLYTNNEFLLSITNPKNRKDPEAFKIWHNWKSFETSYKQIENKNFSSLYVDSKKLNNAILHYDVLQAIMKSRGQKKVTVEASLFVNKAQIENLIYVLTDILQECHTPFKLYHSHLLWNIELDNNPSITLNILLDTKTKLAVEQTSNALGLLGIQFKEIESNNETKYSLYINQMDAICLAFSIPSKMEI